MISSHSTLFANEKTSLDKHWLALGIDLDGCFFNNYYRKARAKKILIKNGIPLTMEEEEAILIRTNRPALRAIIKAAPKYAKLFLLLFTNRQDKQTNDNNCRLNLTMCGFLAYRILARFLQFKLPNIEVEAVEFLMTDLSIGEEADIAHLGKTFQLACAEKEDKSALRWHGFNMQKFTTIYTHIHLLEHLAQTAKQKPAGIIYCPIDDTITLLMKAEYFVKLAALQLPNSVATHCIEYSSHQTDSIATILEMTPTQLHSKNRGSGSLDRNFLKTIRQIEQNMAKLILDKEKKIEYWGLIFDNASHAVETITEHRKQLEENSLISGLTKCDSLF